MFRGDLLIDGYNVLHAAGLTPSSSGAGGLEQCRLELLRLISRKLSPRERLRTTVVFDARDQSRWPSPPREEAQLMVIFADGDGDADATIERLIRQCSAPRRLCVVSSDHRLQRAARRRRARFLDSDEFLKRLSRRHLSQERRDADNESSAKRSGKLPPSEVDAWLRVFGEIELVRFPGDVDPQERHQSETADFPKTHTASAKRDDAVSELPHRKPASPHDQSPELFDEISFWESRVSEIDDED